MWVPSHRATQEDSARGALLNQGHQSRGASLDHATMGLGMRTMLALASVLALALALVARAQVYELYKECMSESCPAPPTAPPRHAPPACAFLGGVLASLADGRPSGVPRTS